MDNNKKVPRLEIEQAHRDWVAALNRMQQADPDFVESAALEVDAAAGRYGALTKRAAIHGLEEEDKQESLTDKIKRLIRTAVDVHPYDMPEQQRNFPAQWR